jgi:hypothetical protein
VRLAGTYHPITYLLNKIPKYIPGVKVVDAIWCAENREIRSTLFDGPAEAKNKLMFQKWRAESAKSMWLKSFDPFRKADVGNTQMSIKDEDNLKTFVLFFDSLYDSQQDIIAITCPDHLFLKNFNVEFSGITGQEKMVLSNLLSSILHTEHKQSIEESEILKRLSRHNTYTLDKIESLETQLSTAENLYSSAISSIISEFLKSFENEWNVSFDIDQQLIKYFAREKMSLSDIQQQVESIATLAYHLNYGSSKIQLDEAYIHSLSSNEQSAAFDNRTTENDDKVIQLLNRYEDAALSINELGGTLNAKEIAKRLDPPVTPPAITDAVKKNRRKIAYLLRQYTNRWKIIRKSIRPIQHLDNAQDTFESKAS